MDDDTVFHQRQAGPRWMRWFEIAVDVLVAAIMALVIVASIGGWGPRGLALTIVPPVVLILAACLVSSMFFSPLIEIDVTGGVLTARLRPLRVLRARADDLVEVTVTTITALEAGGTGYKWTPNGTYLLWHAGPAVRIQTRRGRVVYLQTDRPDDLAAALTTSQSSTPGTNADASSNAVKETGS